MDKTKLKSVYRRREFCWISVLDVSAGPPHPHHTEGIGAMEQEQYNIYRKEEIYHLLEEKKIRYEAMEHPAVYTMEDMEQYHITEKGTVCKNLFLRDAKGKNHFLVTVPNARKVDLKELGQKIGCSKLSFASADRLEKYLHVQQGCVSPFGLLNDASKSVTLIVDADLKREQHMGIHPNDNTASVWLSFRDLEELIEEHGNEVMLVKF